MSNISEEYKKWIKCLQSMNLEGVLLSLKNLDSIKKNNEEGNKYLFKLLLHLSHCADQCSREKLSKEIQLYSIAMIICENLTSIQDKSKFFSAIYFITQYILNKNLYKEAKVVISYLFPGQIIDVNDSFQSSNYYQIASLWHSEIIKNVDKLSADSNISELSVNIDFTLIISKYCSEENGYVFRFSESYLKKLNNFSMSFAFPCLLKLFKTLSTYILTLKKTPVTEGYNRLIYLISLAFHKRSNIVNDRNATDYFRQCDAYFLESFKNYSECYNCYKFFREYTINLFTTNFMSKEIGEVRLNKSFDILNILLQKYGLKNKSVIETVYAVANSFESLFNNWENLVMKKFVDTNIGADDILNMGSFVKRVYTIIKGRLFPPGYLCTKCSEPTKCTVKYDIYNATVLMSAYIKVLSKFSSDNINRKMFLTAKELLEELVSAYEELDKAKCKFSLSLWNICGKMIFNFGLICETRFPEELKTLYEVLCKGVVCYDGLNSKQSSFGLDDPVGTTLHRLCNIHFKQEKYQEAMVYTAFNALLSNSESRKKKAHDMWSNIKLKLIDTPEIQELTMLECLKQDSRLVKDLGVNPILEHYDLVDLCLRELKSLFQIKGNIMLSIKKTLAEIEILGNDLQYGQGVLLFCLHAQQFTKRDLIFDYLSKAINKLKCLKLKVIDHHCLLANLNFYYITEKLYARSEAIKSQMENASFTVKAFKTINGSQKHLFDDEEKEEVIPTYGGVNIEEDNKCANELRDVITTWNNCFRKDLNAIVKGWEPKITLETIIICGEYCRLYKFNIIEEKVWKVAYKLATVLQDFSTCTYITSRSLSLRYINDTWIKDALEYAESFTNINKTSETDVISLFWLSLADFYLDCRKIEQAKKLLKKVTTLPNYDMLINPKIYIYSVDIQFRNYYSVTDEPSQEGYCQLLVETHYLLISLSDVVSCDISKFWCLRFKLFAIEQLFEVMCNIIMPMNSLLAHREITAHMVYGLKHAQEHGMTLRIAQYLKYFCYIDLLRTNVEVCEARLQDLEHILCLEQFQKSMKARYQTENSKKNTSPITTIREAPPSTHISLSRNTTSPELKKKLFSHPDFMMHSSHCQCFMCTNLHYQYSSFSATHIRAQLYALLNYTKEAEHHFHGALKVKVKIDEKDSDINRKYKDYEWKRYCNFTVDIIQYLLDLSMFIVDFEPKQKEDALALIEEALDVASKNDLDKHCISVYATELYFQYFIYDVLGEKLSIAVPDDIPITITNQPVNGCITPKQQVEKVVRNLRRHKSPTAIAVPVITVIDSDEDDGKRGNSPIPKTVPVAPKTIPKKTLKVRNVRRKILTDDDENAEKEELKRHRSERLAKKSIGLSDN